MVQKELVGQNCDIKEEIYFDKYLENLNLSYDFNKYFGNLRENILKSDTETISSLIRNSPSQNIDFERSVLWPILEKSCNRKEWTALCFSKKNYEAWGVTLEEFLKEISNPLFHHNQNISLKDYLSSIREGIKSECIFYNRYNDYVVLIPSEKIINHFISSKNNLNKKLIN